MLHDSHATRLRDAWSLITQTQNTPGFERRKPDMSPAAGAAMRAVLAEMGDELQAEREAAQWYSGTR